MRTDEQVLSDIEAGRVFADRIRETGGDCDCSGFCPTRHNALTVELKDGRVFTRTTLHGFGGLIGLQVSRFDGSPVPLDRATSVLERDVARVLARAERDGRPVLLYLVDRYFGSETLEVLPSQILRVTVVP